MLGIDRTVAHRHLTRGPAKIDTLSRIAGALGVSLGALWDEETEGTTVVIARLPIAGSHIDCIAWLDPARQSPFNAEELLAWEQGGVWYVDRFQNRREPGHPLRRVEVQCRYAASTGHPVSVFFETDSVFARELALGLASHGYTAHQSSDLSGLLATVKVRPPSVLILLAKNPIDIAHLADQCAGKVISTIIISSGDLPNHDPLRGRFFCSKEVVRILVLLRQMVPVR